jgi:hypothetical protein
MTIACGPMVHHIIIIDDDLVRRNLSSTLFHRWLICSGEEADNPATWPYFASVDLWQSFVKALHPKLIEVDLGQFGAKFTLRGGINLDVCSPDSRLIRKWIRKGENFAHGHRSPPRFSGSDMVRSDVVQWVPVSVSPSDAS